jgi:signal transduction histidine kinase
MKIEIRGNGDSYDLLVNDAMELRAETMTVVSNVKESMERNGRGDTEADDVARGILAAVRLCEDRYWNCKRDAELDARSSEGGEA